MANRWKGNFVVATAATSSGTAYAGRADGAWGLNNQLQQKKASLWAIGITPPSAPTSVTATAADSSAVVYFSAPSSLGGTPVLSFNVVSSPAGGVSAGSLYSPIAVTGLTNGTSYTFDVTATNISGTSPSTTSNSVTPLQAKSSLLQGGYSPRMHRFNNGWISSIELNPITWYFDGGTDLAKDGTFFVGVRWTTTPYIAAYPFTNGTTVGTKYANPASTAPANMFGVSIAPNKSAVTVLGDTVQTYAWSSGFGTKFTNSGFGTGAAKGIIFSPNSNTILVSGAVSPYIGVIPFSGSGYGTKYANAATLPTDGLNSMDNAEFNSTQSVILFATYNSPYIHAYNFTAGTGIGTKFANPSSLIATTGGARRSCFTSDATGVFVLTDTDNLLYSYAWNNSTGFGTKYAGTKSLTGGIPTSLISTTAVGISTQLVCYSGTYTLSSCVWDSTNGFGTSYADISIDHAGLYNVGASYLSLSTY